MDEFELDKETYEEVVSLLQSGKREAALDTILPEAGKDAKLAKKILRAIEDVLKSGDDPEEGTAKESSSDAKDSGDGSKSGSSSSKSPTFSTISLPLESPREKSSGTTLIGGAGGIEEVELDKDIFLRVVDQIETANRDKAFDLILEEVNGNKVLAKTLLKSIEADLEEASTVPPQKEARKSTPPATKPAEHPKEKKPKEQAIPASPPTNPEVDAASEEEPDPVALAKKRIRRDSWLTWLLGGPIAFLFYRRGMRPGRAIAANFAICLVALLALGLAFAKRDGILPGSNPADQGTINFMAVAMCPLLADDLDLQSWQRVFCEQRRKRIAYYLYDECRKIDGTESIRGPFSETTLQAGLYQMGRQIEKELNRSQRKKFRELYESQEWTPVSILNVDGRLRMVYPTYGNAPGELRLSVETEK